MKETLLKNIGNEVHKNLYKLTEEEEADSEKETEAISNTGQHIDRAVQLDLFNHDVLHFGIEQIELEKVFSGQPEPETGIAEEPVCREHTLQICISWIFG